MACPTRQSRFKIEFRQIFLQYFLKTLSLYLKHQRNCLSHLPDTAGHALRSTLKE